MIMKSMSLLRRHDLEVMPSSSNLLVLLFFFSTFMLAQCQRLDFLFPPEGPLIHHHLNRHHHRHLLSQGSSHHSKITLPFNDGFVVLDLPKNALRLPKSVTRKQGRLHNNNNNNNGGQLRHHRLQSQLSNVLSTGSLPRIIPNGGQSHWEPVMSKRKKNQNLPWDALVSPSQAFGSTAKRTRDTMTLFIPTVAQTNRVNSINEQLPSYQNRPSFTPRPTTPSSSAQSMQGQQSQASGQQHQNAQNLQELAPLFVPIDSPPNRDLQGNDGDNLIPNELLEQILAEVIPKIEAEDRSKSHVDRQPTPFVQMVAQVVPREKDEGFPYFTGEALQSQQTSNGPSANLIQKPRPFPSFKNTIQSFKMNNYPAAGPAPQPVTQQQQQPEVQQQQQEEPIVQVKEPMQSYEEPEQEQQQDYEPPAPPAPVKGYNPPPPQPRPRPAPAPTKGYSPPPPPPPAPTKGYSPPPPPPAVKGPPPAQVQEPSYPSKGRPSPQPVVQQQQQPEPYQPPAPVKGPPPVVKGRPAPVKGYQPPVPQAPLPQAPVKGYSPPAPVKGPAPRPRPAPAPVKGYNPPPPPPPPPQPVKGYSQPAPAPVKGYSPPPPPPPAPVKGYSPPPPPPRPAQTKGYSPRPQVPAKGYSPQPSPAPVKGPSPRPQPQSYPTKGSPPPRPPPPPPAVKGPSPSYQTPLRQPAVKGRPTPQVTQAPYQEEEPQYEVKGQRPAPPAPVKSPQRPQYTAAALQSTPSVSTTTILYDERATYTSPASSTPSSLSYDDQPNADIGFDDEGTAFSEEDMPSKMPLDDDSDYPSANLKNSTTDDDDEYNKPRTVPPVRSLPLSPANKARRAQSPGDRDNIEDDAPNNAEVEVDDSPFETTVAPVSRNRRPSNPVFGERIRELPRTEPNSNSYGSSSNAEDNSNNNNNNGEELREYASNLSKETVSSDKNTRNEYDFEDPVPADPPADTFEDYVDSLDSPSASSTTSVTQKKSETSTEASNSKETKIKIIVTNTTSTTR